MLRSICCRLKSTFLVFADIHGPILACHKHDFVDWSPLPCAVSTGAQDDKKEPGNFGDPAKWSQTGLGGGDNFSLE